MIIDACAKMDALFHYSDLGSVQRLDWLIALSLTSYNVVAKTLQKLGKKLAKSASPIQGLLSCLVSTAPKMGHNDQQFQEIVSNTNNKQQSTVRIV